MWKPLFTSLTALAMTSAVAQQSFLISEPQITTCAATLQDTGGEAGGGYQNNEDFITVICPNTPGQGISLNFGATPFFLSTASLYPMDRLSIWDGPDDTYPLIGSWTGTNSPGIVSASYANVQSTGGCLTVRFVSDNSGTGRFAAFISCMVPCEPPTASAIIAGAATEPLVACQNGPITFDGSASTGAQGLGISEYKWDFGDGVVDSLSGATVTHSYATGGEHIVHLYLTDNAGCASVNSVDLRVLVSTTPSFAGTALADTTVCPGQPVTLNATGIASVSWSTIPIADFGNGAYIPDDQNQSFSSSIELSGFAPNATLNDVSDLLSVCVSMEHSFMADLVIFLTCPNGQNVYLHGQGGLGTFLGNALDGETNPPTPGECWAYCWDPTATNGTWAENAGGTLPSGSYASFQPMTQLLGCPLNGDWTLTISDLFGADDGFICSWNINLAPTTYPGTFSFTPVLGVSDPDSAQWSGANLSPDPTDPLIAVVNTPVPGTFPYVFTVTDNFGCAYDTSVAVTVLDVTVQGIDGPTVIANTGPVLYTAQGAGADVSTFLWQLPPGWSWADDPNTQDAPAFLLPPITFDSFQLCVVAEGLGCTSTPVCIQTDVVTSTTELGGGAEVQVFPNPSSGQVVVVRPAGKSALITVVDAFGRTVHQQQMQGTPAMLDLGHLSDGTYLLQWWNGAHPQRHRVVLAR